ncbi:hypothetical protein C8R45DRAFT_933234 [Mycena sanguinolenta]|nr:hypothetical protein C8R45DRAFT_933234 [Mycena sanguinolenta]
MCDAEKLQLSAMSSTMSLIPGNIFPHLALGVLSASLVGYATHYNCPSERLGRLNTALNTVEKTLAHAKAASIRDYFILAELYTQFLRRAPASESPTGRKPITCCRTKLTLSALHTCLLEGHDLSGWRAYLQNVIAISRSLIPLEREMEPILTTSPYQVLIEAANRRKLRKDINEIQAILHAGMHHTTASGYEV